MIENFKHPKNDLTIIMNSKMIYYFPLKAKKKTSVFFLNNLKYGSFFRKLKNVLVVIQNLNSLYLRARGQRTQISLIKLIGKKIF